MEPILKVTTSLEAPFYIPQKNGTPKLFHIGHPRLFVQKIDVGVDHPYVFYIWNDSAKQAVIEAPKMAAFSAIGSQQRWQTSIVQPPLSLLMFLEPRPGRMD